MTTRFTAEQLADRATQVAAQRALPVRGAAESSQTDEEHAAYVQEWERDRLAWRSSGEPLADPIAEAVRLALNAARPYYIDILSPEEYAELATDIVAALDGVDLVIAPAF